MTLALYVGNALKDLLSAPRPLGLPYGRQKLLLLSGGSEEAELNAKARSSLRSAACGQPACSRAARHACPLPLPRRAANRPLACLALLPHSPLQEYGAPSSHTLNSLCLNFFAVWWAYDRELVGPSTAAALYAGVAVWVLWIGASRLYLGLHTPIGGSRAPPYLPACPSLPGAATARTCPAPAPPRPAAASLCATAAEQGQQPAGGAGSSPGPPACRAALPCRPCRRHPGWSHGGAGGRGVLH